MRLRLGSVLSACALQLVHALAYCKACCCREEALLAASRALHRPPHQRAAIQGPTRGASLAGSGVTPTCCVQGSIIIGILFVTFISWIPGQGASYLGSSADGYPGALQHAVAQQACKLGS